VWDYKTGREGDAAKDHLEEMQLIEGEKHDVSWRVLEVEADRAVVWKNLQLPLYVWAMRQRNPGVPVEAGYLHLPAVVSGAGDRLWSALDEPMMRSALECAEEAVKRMKAGQFAPADEVAFDEWEELFMGDASESVADISEWKEEAA
jgi:ATP-dependent helicase/nuclease subunit B